MKGPAFQISAKSAGGGGSGCAYQQAILPPSSIFNTPKAWVHNNALFLQNGIGNDWIHCIGDKLYRIGSGVITIYNLITKVWEAEKVDYSSTKGYPATTSCVYEDYKIFIVQNYSGFKTVYSFNTIDKSVSTLTRFPIQFTELDDYQQPSVYCPKHRCIICGISGYDGDSSKSHAKIGRYDVATNTWRTTDGIGTNEQTYSRAVIQLDETQDLCYFTENTGKRVSFNITSLARVDVGRTVLGFIPSSWIPFQGKVLVANGTNIVYYDLAKDEIIPTAFPNSPAVWNAKNIYLYNNEIVQVNYGSPSYQIPYIAKEPTDKIPVWGFVKGQRFCGTKELPIINKPTITTQWQTVQSDFEICLGEYDSAGEYRILVSSDTTISV